MYQYQAETFARRAIGAGIALTVAFSIGGALASPTGYGPVLNPGTPDAAVMLYGHPVQLEYLRCVPAWRDGRAMLWEDGSLSLVADDGALSDCR